MASMLTWTAAAAAIAAVAAVATAMAMFWNSLGPSQISLSGWLAMIFGIVAMLALGIGLMTAMFISNRRGYDDNARHDR